MATGRVTGVVKDDIAYQASLRNGQQVEQIYFDPLDYSKNIVVSLRNSSQKNRVVKYLGKKGKSKVIYRFYIDMSDDLFEPDTCLGWFGEVKIPFLDVEQGKASLTIQN